MEMKKGPRSRGVSKGEWLEAGLRTIQERGVAGLTVEGLARVLGIARAGFYWHFKDRDDLLRQVLDHWVHELTEIVTDNPEVLALEPRGRLRMAAQMVVDLDLAGYDMAIRQWALNDRAAARAVRDVDRTRLDFTMKALRELGFSGEEIEVRGKAFLCYFTWENVMFPGLSRKRRRALTGRAVDLLSSR